ncbi:MAG: hypothetical protein HY785_01060 [Oscillatoriophycideae cyanobacterium NC_groundwater_1537_Pr4_S-0.65um_50_18]|nr:hypothetical protein [Oscillatoriophycideae cyanobacterium NC_groundwater_1537_Pr4_S-0.65um_50_18]
MRSLKGKGAAFGSYLSGLNRPIACRMPRPYTDRLYETLTHGLTLNNSTI